MLATFNTADTNVEGILSFDVTNLLNTLIMNGQSTLSVKLQQSTRNINGPFYIFSNFQLTTIPAPGTLLLIGLTLPLVIGRRRFTSQL